MGVIRLRNWERPALLSFMAQGGWILLATFALIHWNLLAPARLFLNSFEYVVFAAALLLAWRFHSSRTFFVLLALLLAQRSLAFFSPGHTLPNGAGLVAWQAIAVLLPLNFVLMAVVAERGFAASSVLPLCALLFIQAVAVSALSQSGWSALHPDPLALPGYADVAFLVTAAILLVRWGLATKPVEGALCWALAASFLALRSGGMNHESTLYFTAAALILGVSVVETSYLLAYNDELTDLPSRRAFNEALHRIEAPYAIATVDIDHFKKFNDSYGHDTGDEVLRLVAGQLARVTGGGKAYRCGGEEFSILFPGKTATDIAGDLARLRAGVEAASFRLRHSDRRKITRGPSPDRRLHQKAPKGLVIRQLADRARSGPLSVTVSIGVADSQKGLDADAILQIADRALYRAKASGRNRVEAASSADRRRGKTASIA